MKSFQKNGLDETRMAWSNIDNMKLKKKRKLSVWLLNENPYFGFLSHFFGLV